MRTSSMLTRQVSGGGGARRLWRAQTNPYADQNLARARMTDPHLRAPINDRPNGRSCISGGRGVCGARKLIPMPITISRAPDLPRTLTPLSPRSLPLSRPLVAALHFVPWCLRASLVHLWRKKA